MTVCVCDMNTMVNVQRSFEFVFFFAFADELNIAKAELFELGRNIWHTKDVESTLNNDFIHAEN